MKRFFGVSTFWAVVLLCASAYAQNPDYVLTLTDASGPSGNDVDVQVLLDNNGSNLSGWSIGVAHDSTLLSLVDVVDGSTTATVKAGSPPDFDAYNLMPSNGDGWTVGVVIDFLGANSLGTGTGLELHVATYNLTGPDGSTTTVDFVDTLGVPPVSTLVVDTGGASITPVQNSGTITIGGTAPYTLTAADVTVGTGGSVDVSISLDNPSDADGFSFGLTHDDTLATLNSIDQGSVVAATNGGSGAAFFTTNVNPAGGPGGFVGCVVSLSPPFDVIPAGTGNEVAVFNYTGGSPGTSSLDFTDTLGSPPVALIVSVNGQSVVPDVVSGSIEVTGVVVTQFIRGDANLDGSVNVSDAVYLAKWLFGVGPAGTCNDAGDANDNGTLEELIDPMYILAYLFNAGPPPPAPFPGCGPDTTGTPDCADNGGTCP